MNHEISGVVVRQGVPVVVDHPQRLRRKPVHKHMITTMVRAAEQWRTLKVTGFEHRQMDTLRRELDQNLEAKNDIKKPSADVRQKNLSSIYRT